MSQKFGNFSLPCVTTVTSLASEAVVQGPPQTQHSVNRAPIVRSTRFVLCRY